MECNNILKISFVDGQNENEVDTIIDLFSDYFPIKNFYMYWEEELDGITHLEVGFKTAYSGLKEEDLKHFCDKYKIKIIGVAYALTYNYVSSFNVGWS